LVAVKIEVNPVLTGAAFGTAQKITIKRSGLCQRRDGKSQVEWLHGVVCLKSKKQFCTKNRVAVAHLRDSRLLHADAPFCIVAGCTCHCGSGQCSWLIAHCSLLIAHGSWLMAHGSWPNHAPAGHAQLVALGGLSPLVCALHG
jgi:hypothetical protein